MIVEEFDFKSFFNSKNVNASNQNPIAAVSIITPKQAITRLTVPDSIYGILGRGEHGITKQKIAKEILPIKDEKVKLPVVSQWLGKIKLEQDFNEQLERKRSIKEFLNNVINIEYVSKEHMQIIIVKFPGFTQNDWSKLRISEDMCLGLEQIITQLDRDEIPCKLLRFATEQRCNFENYKQAKDYIETLVDPDFVFPFEEKIIAQTTLCKDKGSQR